MKATKKFMLAAAFGLAGFMTVPASAQWYPQNDRGVYRNDSYDNYGRDSERQAYQQGYNDGSYDRQNGTQRRTRNWKHDYDAQAYRDGYNEGLRGRSVDNRGGNGRWGDRDNNGRWGRGRDRRDGDGRWGNGRNRDGRWGDGRNRDGRWGNGSYGNGGNYGYNNYAAQIGYQDGQHTGRQDAQNGQRYRPTEWKGYREADHGLSESGMSKSEFQNMYRQAYVEGYEQAYYQYRGRRY